MFHLCKTLHGADWHSGVLCGLGTVHLFEIEAPRWEDWRSAHNGNQNVVGPIALDGSYNPKREPWGIGKKGMNSIRMFGSTTLRFQEPSIAFNRSSRYDLSKLNIFDLWVSMILRIYLFAKFVQTYYLCPI